MKKLIIWIARFIGGIPFVGSYYSGFATVLMMHRVGFIDKNKLLPNENMKISPSFLESFILDLKSKGYDFIDLDELYEIIKSDKTATRKIVFTLDDGYKDNYEVAYPIFKKYNIPFTVYITTSFPEKEAVLWWYILEDLILNNNELILSNDRRFICNTKSLKESVFMKVRRIILSLDQTSLLVELDKMFSYYKIDWLGKCEEMAMTWDEIKELSLDSLCTIACHTKNHYTLNKLSNNHIVKEIIDANNLLESKIGKKIKHFSYPFGSQREVGRRECDIVKNLGFKTATTTRCGNIFKEHDKYLECLPRIMLTENYRIKYFNMVRKNKITTL